MASASAGLRRRIVLSAPPSSERAGGQPLTPRRERGVSALAEFVEGDDFGSAALGLIFRTRCGRSGERGGPGRWRRGGSLELQAEFDRRIGKAAHRGERDRQAFGLALKAQRD